MIPEAKLEQLTGRLREDRERLRHKLVTLKDMDFGDAPGTDNEEADETEEMANKLGTITLLEKHLNGVEAALKKIAAGDYGVCEKCSQEISIEVLEADPQSTLCKNCKRP